jgi:hypothetical protein
MKSISKNYIFYSARRDLSTGAYFDHIRKKKFRPNFEVPEKSNPIFTPIIP